MVQIRGIGHFMQMFVTTQCGKRSGTCVLFFREFEHWHACGRVK